MIQQTNRSLTSLFYLALALLCTHELDAIINSEWRLLFILRALNDDLAGMWFVLLHLPMFWAFFHFGHHANSKIQMGFRAAVMLFTVVHAGLHFRLSDHPDYLFEGLISNAYIYGSAVSGLGYLMLMGRTRRQFL